MSKKNHDYESHWTMASEPFVGIRISTCAPLTRYGIGASQNGKSQEVEGHVYECEAKYLIRLLPLMMPIVGSYLLFCTSPILRYSQGRTP